MRAITKHISLALISGGFLLAIPTRSVADMVTHTLTADASGSLGDSNFSDALVTLTFVGDTGNVTNPSSGIFRNPVGTATVTVDGTTATLVAPPQADVFVNQTDSTAGIETFARILTVQNSALANYNLTTSIGPLTGTAAGVLDTSFSTSAGFLIITSLASTGTFQATVSTAVPEPASLLLMGLGITGMAAATCVRRAPARRTK
jgi:hypothetical protein